jgi:hypothetical protein
MLVSLQGPTLSLETGDEYKNCDPAEAKRLVEAGFAVPIAESKVDLAVAKTPAKETRKRK